jgi:ubiquinone/menaquinone biosynthesis C-methylase UbiE
MSSDIAEHYRIDGLEDRILAGVAAAGLDADSLAARELSPADEFHLGGRQATIDLAEQLDIHSDMRLLDVGCGIGGPARHLADTFGCHVSGIDLTEGYVTVANSLSRRVGLADLVGCRQGTALDLPFDEASFDGALLLHVGMNIDDKATLCREVARVMKPGGFFAIYDVMRTGPGEPAYPLPWASSPAVSFVRSADDYREALEAAGFQVGTPRARAEFATGFIQKMQAAAAASGLPPLGLHTVIPDAFATKMGNLRMAIEAGVLAPTEIIARAPYKALPLPD